MSNRPTEPGLYLMRTKGCGWYNLLVRVEGGAPYLHCEWWDMKESKLGHGTYPLYVDDAAPIRLRGENGEDV